MRGYRPKYGNQKTKIGPHTFDSKKEAARFQVLTMFEHAGEIADLRLQPAYTITVNGKKICTYKADFSYLDNRIKRIVVEDVKGFETPVFKLKAKLFQALYPEYEFLITK